VCGGPRDSVTDKGQPAAFGQGKA